MSIITAIKSNYGKYIAKGVGATALYLCGRDAHTWGKVKAEERRKTKDALAAEYYLLNTMSLNKPSKSVDNLKQGVFRFELSQGIRGFVNSFIGYFKGLGASLVSNVIPVALGLTALLAKNKTIAKASGIGLGVIAAFTFVKDGLGIGRGKQL